MPASNPAQATDQARAAQSVQVGQTDAASGLQLGDVLRSSAEFFPGVLEALADRDAALSRIRSASGAFDTEFASGGVARTTGFFDGRILENKITQPFAPLGGRAYVSHRISDGTFPIYEDINFTNTAGELKVGVVLSLLRDRAFDQRRFNQLDAQLGARAADFDVLLRRISVQHQAAQAYFSWVYAWRQAQIYRELLVLAEERQARLSDQVDRGLRAAIALTENRQIVLRRQSLLVEAERALESAAAALALFWRDNQGEPQILAPAVRPGPTDSSPEELAQALRFAAQTRENRPELRSVDIEIARADAAVALSKNQTLPSVEFGYELGGDIGRVQEGGVSRSGLDNILSLRISTPLQRNVAKGRLAEAQAKRRALAHKQQRLSEQIDIEVERIRIDLVAAERVATLAQEEVQQAQAMQIAEARLAESGASDFFRLNLREETAADARIRALQAQLRRKAALVNLYAASVNLEPLGL